MPCFRAVCRCVRNDKIPCQTELVKKPCRLSLRVKTSRKTANSTKTALESRSDPLLPDTFIVRAQAGTRGKSRENAVARGRLFSPVPGCSRHRGPQRDRRNRAAVLLHPIRTFDVDPRARHTFALSQSAATVMLRPATPLSGRKPNPAHGPGRRRGCRTVETA